MSLSGAATIVASVLGIILWAACSEASNGGDGSADERMLVMAAASLSGAMPVLIERFGRQTGGTIDLALGATGSLAAQIENGAPADLFFAADEVTMQRLAANGAICPSSVRTYAEGRLVLAWRAGLEAPTGPHALADPRYEVVAIANPGIAPYGAAAREVLERSGVWKAVESRIVLGENVAQTYQLVRTGNADVALLARSIVDTATTEFIPIDPQLHAPIRQAVGTTGRSRHPAAPQFLAFVLSDEGQAILAEHGFGPAPR